jgi:hypothetical protein
MPEVCRGGAGEVGDLWQALGDDRQPLRGALAALDGLLSEHD